MNPVFPNPTRNSVSAKPVKIVLSRSQDLQPKINNLAEPIYALSRLSKSVDCDGKS
jgi:hypothetical protein